jgi:hypothetical protein
VLARIDSALRSRSFPVWIAFRTIAGLLTALGLFCWVGLWFKRNLWLGIAQALMCGSVLANELGLLRSRGSRLP